MAEDLNQQEPTAEEKAKFENDVLKAAEEAMKMEAEANKAGASDQGAGDASAEQPAENADSPAENNAAAVRAYKRSGRMCRKHFWNLDQGIDLLLENTR